MRLFKKQTKTNNNNYNNQKKKKKRGKTPHNSVEPMLCHHQESTEQGTIGKTTYWKVSRNKVTANLVERLVSLVKIL